MWRSVDDETTSVWLFLSFNSTHLTLILHFYTPWQQQKIRSFMFSLVENGLIYFHWRSKTQPILWQKRTILFKCEKLFRTTTNFQNDWIHENGGKMISLWPNQDQLKLNCFMLDACFISNSILGANVRVA